MSAKTLTASHQSSPRGKQIPKTRVSKCTRIAVVQIYVWLEILRARSRIMILRAWLLGVKSFRARAKRLSQAQQMFLSERGGVTAEYAIVIIAAVAFAGLLVAIMRSGEVQAALTRLIENALNSAG